MTRQTYVKFAEMFRTSRPSEENYSGTLVWRKHVVETADIFYHDNPRFSRIKFYEACGYPD